MGREGDREMRGETGGEQVGMGWVEGGHGWGEEKG